jgi:hypothetical protein
VVSLVEDDEIPRISCVQDFSLPILSPGEMTRHDHEQLTMPRVA